MTDLDAAGRLSTYSVKALEELIRDILPDPMPAPPKKRSAKQIAAEKRRVKMQAKHDKMFPDGEFCGCCC
jgi:hypothetical protein